MKSTNCDTSMDDILLETTAPGGTGELGSNWSYRKDYRTDSQTTQDISNGVRKQTALMNHIMVTHAAQYPNWKQEGFWFHSWVNLDDGKINTGNHYDGLDAEVIATINDGKEFKFLLELECMEYSSLYARIKRDKIERCIIKQAPLIHGHATLNEDEAKIFFLSVDDLVSLHSKLNSKKVNSDLCGSYLTKDPNVRRTTKGGTYGGKQYWRLDVSNSEFKHVDINLKPEDTYKKLLQRMVKHRFTGD